MNRAGTKPSPSDWVRGQRGGIFNHHWEKTKHGGIRVCVRCPTKKRETTAKDNKHIVLYSHQGGPWKQARPNCKL
jgi:hypothetical protein